MKNLILVLSFSCSLITFANSQVDALFAEYDKPNVPGAAVAIFKEGTVAYQKAYGLARVKGGVPATLSTNFRLASLTKQFTAMGIMILVDKGKLSFQDHITDMFPDFPSYGKKITVEHLLHHQSGLIDYEDNIPSGLQGQLSDADVLNILKKETGTYFTPGSQYRYSNGGYCTLSSIIAKVSGLSFPEFMRREVFSPLGMKHSLVYVAGGPTIENRAYGHTGTSETDQNVTSATLGDGGVYTSVEDWFLWDEALYHNPLVSPSLQEAAFSPGVLSDGSKTSYGYGWMLDTYHGLFRQAHTGSTIGFRTAVTRFPEKHLTVVVFVNRAGSAPWETARQVADLYLK